MNECLSFEEVQQESFKVLLKLKEIFDEHGWKYYLAYGTLIGAIRHNGFIPWDDDIDVYVPRKDYDAFINYCIENEEKIAPYKIMHISANPNYIYGLARFTNTDFRSEYFNVKDYGLGTFVDLYPLDDFVENDRLAKKANRIIRDIMIMGGVHIPRGESKLRYLLKLPYCWIVKHKNLRKTLINFEKMSKTYEGANTDTYLIFWETSKHRYSKSRYFTNDVYHVFNGVEFRIPDNYDELLRKIYGDYMQVPPENERIVHHDYKIYHK